MERTDDSQTSSAIPTSKIQKCKKKKTKIRRDVAKLPASLIDTPYIYMPLKNIYSRKVKKYLEKRTKQLFECSSQPMFCPMCKSFTYDEEHAIKATLRFDALKQNEKARQKKGRKTRRDKYIKVKSVPDISRLTI